MKRERKDKKRDWVEEDRTSLQKVLLTKSYSKNYFIYAV